MSTPANTSYRKSSFGPAFFFISKRRRAALAAYYEFCRLMDDIADEPNRQDPQAELNFWQEEVQRMFQATPQTPLGKQLAAVAAEYELTPDRFLLLIEGMRADLTGKTYDTLADLDAYLYRVAVIVGLATLDIVGVKGPQAQTLADNLGRAVQLTNIIRDVPTDAQLGRVYLPADMLAQEDLTREEVLTGRPCEKLARLLAKLDQTACSYYQLADDNMAQLPRLKMLPCRMISCVYAQNLAKIRKTGFRFTEPVKLTKTEKIRGVFHALLKTIGA